MDCDKLIPAGNFTIVIPVQPLNRYVPYAVPVYPLKSITFSVAGFVPTLNVLRPAQFQNILSDKLTPAGTRTVVIAVQP